MDEAIGTGRSSARGNTSGRPPLVADLPPFPVVALRALQMVSNSENGLQELHEVIRTDQAFSTELLRITNCPLFGIRTQVKSTMQAVTLLGFKRVKAVVLTIGMRTYLGSSLKIPAIRTCWRHSLACAMLSEELARASSPGAPGNASEGLIVRPKGNAPSPQQAADPGAVSAVNPELNKDVAYTAGITHDLGRLALAVVRPQEYAELLRTTGDGSRDLLQREHDAFGLDHSEFGGALGLAWNFPPELIEVMTLHHAAVEGARMDLLTAVQFGCRMTDALGFDTGGSARPISYEEIIGKLPEREHRHFDCDPKALARTITHKIIAIEPL